MNLKDLKVIKDKEIDIDEYLKQNELVKSKMEYPDWLGYFSKEDIEQNLGTNIHLWMFYKDEEFVCSMMTTACDQHFLDKLELDLNPEYVIDYGPQFVNNKYIGNKLQYQMIEYLNEYSINNNYKYVLSTVHPDNIYSINNFLKSNFKKIGYKEFKRGERNIYLKKL